MKSRSLAALLALTLSACGNSGSEPCKPPTANFSVQGTTGTPFQVVEFVTAGGTHHLFQPPDGDPLAPHTFYLMNGMWPITGSFLPSPDAHEAVPVFVRSPDVNQNNVLDSTVIPLPSTPAPAPLTITTGVAPFDCPVATVNPGMEIRIEMYSPTGAFNVPFTLTVGGEGISFLACGTSRLCGTPTTVYFDNAAAPVDAIITKSFNDNQAINLELYVNGDLRDSDQANGGNTTAKVHLDR